MQHASTLLAELDQSPPQSTHNAMKGISSALVSPALLRHKDKEVGLLVAICISEIMRIVAPDAPYSDDTLKVSVGPVVCPPWSVIVGWDVPVSCRRGCNSGALRRLREIGTIGSHGRAFPVVMFSWT